LWTLNGRRDDSLEERPKPHEILAYSSSRLQGLFEKAAHSYQSGISLQKIAEQEEVAKSTVRKTLINGGVRIRPHSGTPEGRAQFRNRTRCGGHAPYGYAYLDGKLVAHPKEIEAHRRILALRTKGLGLSAIADALNAKSILTRNGKKWDHSTVRKIINRASDESLNRIKENSNGTR
jgi:hypothetical protein